MFSESFDRQLHHVERVDGNHSAGVRAALSGSEAVVRSWASRTRPVCTMAATMAPTIGAVRYSQASLKLPVATIGPSARAGLKAAPVRAPPMMIEGQRHPDRKRREITGAA